MLRRISFGLALMSSFSIQATNLDIEESRLVTAKKHIPNVVERFPGLNRSAKAPGNLKVYTGATKEKPLAPRLQNQPLNGAQFVECTLPVKAMQSVTGKWKVIDNHKVTTLERGKHQATSLHALQGQTSVEGSGGGYLSNEISYRSIRLMQQFDHVIPVGHIHTPRIKGYEANTEKQIVDQIRDMVKAAASIL